MKPTISVCVASIRADTLPATIRAIRAQSFHDWELIVVGQGDDRDVQHVVLEAAVNDARIRFAHSDNRGLSIGRNIGISAARADIIAMTDDDCEPQPDWLDVVLHSLASNPSVGLIGGSLI